MIIGVSNNCRLQTNVLVHIYTTKIPYVVCKSIRIQIRVERVRQSHRDLQPDSFVTFTISGRCLFFQVYQSKDNTYYRKGIQVCFSQTILEWRSKRKRKDKKSVVVLAFKPFSLQSLELVQDYFLGSLGFTGPVLSI